MIIYHDKILYFFRLHIKKRNYDPLDYTSIETVAFWVVDEEPTPELNCVNLETEIYREDVIPSIEYANITSKLQN